MQDDSVQISLLGTTFSIRSDQNPAYLRQLIEEYAGRVNKIERAQASKDPLQVAILAGILLCDELRQSKEQVHSDEAELGSLAEQIIARLDDHL